MLQIQRYFFNLFDKTNKQTKKMSVESIWQTVCVFTSICAFMQGILCGHISLLQSFNALSVCTTLRR